MNSMSYNAEYFSIINDLATISPSMIFTKDDNGTTTVLRANKSKSIFFRVVAPTNYFEYDGNRIAFNNFAEFYELINVFKVKNLYHDNNLITIENEVGKINYVLANEESLMKSPSKISLDVPDVTFTMSNTQLAEIRKINSLLSSKYCNVFFKNKMIAFNLYTGEQYNSFNREFTPEYILNADDPNSPQVGDIEFPIYSEIFAKLPDETYKVSIYANGFISFAFQKNDIDVISGTVKVVKA